MNHVRTKGVSAMGAGLPAGSHAAPVEPLEPRVLLAVATLDRTFGFGGMNAVHAGWKPSPFDLAAYEYASGPDGSLVGAGAAGGQLALARFDPDGQPTAAFGKDGLLRTRVVEPGHGASLAIQSDGKVLVAGTDGNDWVVARLEASGAPDASFGTGGTVTLGFGEQGQRATGIVVQPDGKLVIIGNNGPRLERLALVRLNPDGSFDTSFHRDGKDVTRFASTGPREDVLVQPDGKILVHGSSGLYRFRADGSIDTSFGDGDGAVGIAYGPDRAALLPDGKILLAGAGVLARFESDGSRDASFGDGDGEVRDLAPIHPRSLTVGSDGTVYVAGTRHDGSYPYAAPVPYLAVVRYAPDGSEAGFAYVNRSSHSAPHAYALPGGKLLLAGYGTFQSLGRAEMEFFAARLLTDEPWQASLPHEPSLWVQAEDFDRGGDGVAYHDRDARNRGGAYRATGVDVELRDADRHLQHVSSALAGEWIEYTVSTLSTRHAQQGLDVQFRVASRGPGGTFHLELDGRDVTGPMRVPDTGSWTAFRTVTASAADLALAAREEHVFRLVMDEAGASGAVGNFDWFRFVKGIDGEFADGGLAPDLGGRLLPEPGGTTILVRDGLARLSDDGRTVTQISADWDWSAVHDAILQPDGKVLIAVTERIGENAAAFLVRRFDRDGSPDPSFGDGGAVRTEKAVVRLALQPDGGILLDDGTLHRYRPDGRLDDQFDPAPGALAGVAADGSIYTYATEIGWCNPYTFWEECERHMYVRRMLPDGRPDTEYADGGVWKVTLREDDEDTPWFWGQQVLPDGSFVSGTARNNRNDFNGAYETSGFILRANGTITGSVSAYGDYYFRGEHLAARPDGLIVIAGRLVDDERRYRDRDWHWGITGIDATAWRDLFPYDRIYDIAFREDGKLLVEGGAGVVRFDAPPVQQTARAAIPWQVGERIEAEDFDDGGQGVAYRDRDARNRGGAYRVSSVDIAAIEDAGPGYAVGWTEPGEWLEYTVDVPVGGDYRLDLRLANPAAGARLRVEVDGSDVSGPIDLPATGGFHRYTTVTVTARLRLSEGRQVLRLVMDRAASNGAVGNVNWLRLSPRPERRPYHGTPFSAGQRIEAEAFDRGGFGISYLDDDRVNTGGAPFRETAVDLAETNDESGGYDVVDVEVAEWLEYTVRVTNPGIYNVFLRGSADRYGQGVRVTLDGTFAPARSGSLSGSGEVGEPRWSTANVATLELSAGLHVLRLERAPSSFAGEVRFNWLELRRSPRNLVPSFGDGGVMRPFRGTPLAVQEDGKVIVARRTRNGPVLVRYDEGGRIDATFATSDPVAATAFQRERPDFHVLPDGLGFLWRRDQALYRYDHNGLPLAPFGDAGKLSVGLPFVHTIDARSGQIIIVSQDEQGRARLRRFLPDGRATHPTGGVVLPVPGEFGGGGGGGDVRVTPFGVAVQRDGGTVVALEVEGTTQQVFALRFRPDGTWDRGFGQEGFFVNRTNAFRSGDTPSGLVLLADDRLIVRPRSGYYIHVLSPDGRLVADVWAHQETRAYFAQRDGRVVAVGGSFDEYDYGRVERGWSLSRFSLDPSTSFDATFAGLLPEFALTGPGADAIAITPDGAIYVGGYYLKDDGQARYALMKFEGDAPTSVTLSRASSYARARNAFVRLRPEG